MLLNPERIVIGIGYNGLTKNKREKYDKFSNNS